MTTVYMISMCMFFFFKQKTAYEMRISDWSSDVCSSDLDRGNNGLQALEAATGDLMAAAAQVPGIAYAFTLFNTATPKIYADIDRVKSEMLGLPPGRFSDPLAFYHRSAFVTAFNFLLPTFRVSLQPDAAFRHHPPFLSTLPPSLSSL